MTLNTHKFQYKTTQSKTGRIWLDRNIGTRVTATAPFDLENSGYYFSLLSDKSFLLSAIPDGFRLPQQLNGKKK